MTRRWFWPLILVACLLLSLAGSLFAALGIVAWGIWRDPGPISFGFYIDPWAFVIVGVLTAIAVALFVLASRVR